MQAGISLKGSHPFLEDIDADVISQNDRHGNAIADYWARQGAAMCDVSQKADLNRWVDSTAWTILERIATIIEHYSEAHKQE